MGEALGQKGGFLSTDATLISGVAIDGEDFDDTFEGKPVHVGAAVVPAVLTAGALVGRRDLDQVSRQR